LNYTSRVEAYTIQSCRLKIEQERVIEDDAKRIVWLSSFFGFGHKRSSREKIARVKLKGRPQQDQCK
jgi:hypothetical protein